MALFLCGMAGCAPLDRPEEACSFGLGDGGNLRLFVVTHRMSLADADDYAAYEASYRRHLSAIRPCLSKLESRPNLVVFPEDAGLVAWFIGRRGLLSRGAPNAEAAFNGLYSGHFRAADAYRARFPGISPARALTLAASDVAHRAVERTFSGIARELNAWVLTSANLPRVEKVADVGVFGDRDAHDGAYVAIGPEVNNAALLFTPDGRLAGRIDKVYLTDPEEQLLDLSSAPLEKLDVLTLPPHSVRIGVAISRDAFYPPYLQRLEDLGAELVVQPEAWSGWTIEQLEGDWLPDTILSSGWLHTQKYRAFRHNAAPMLTGNLFDFAFDGQAWITRKAEPAHPVGGFVGSREMGGWLAIGPWAAPDPAEQEPSLSLKERQARLRQMGRALSPGSGSPLEGQYADGVIAADLELYGEGVRPPEKPVQPGPGTPSVPVDGSASSHQRNPDVAYDEAGRVWVVYTQLSAEAGSAVLALARSDDDGESWNVVARVLPERADARAERAAIAARKSNELLLAWQERRDGIEQVRVASGFPPMVRWLEPTGSAQWEPDVAIGPHGEAAVAWVDFRRGPSPAIRVACAPSVAGPFGASRELDGTTASLPRAGPSQFQPTLAFLRDGRLAAAWIDYRERDWQVYASVGWCELMPPGVRVTEDDEAEVLAADPQLAVGSSGELLLAWEEVRSRRGHADVRAALYAGERWVGLPQLSKGADDGAFSSRFRPTVGHVGGSYRLVFQDTAFGKSALGTATISPRVLVLQSVERFDDTGEAATQLTRPRLAVRPDGSRAVVVFEDDRDGWTRVRASALP